MTPFFLCSFFSFSPCPPPLSPPFLSVQVGLWLPSAKNSVLSSQERLCYSPSLSQHRPTHAGAQTVCRVSFKKLQQTRAVLFSELWKLVFCSTELLINYDLQSFTENTDEDQPGDEFTHHNFLNDPFSPHEIGPNYDTEPGIVCQVEYSWGIFQTQRF